jgi:hypothetical protein
MKKDDIPEESEDTEELECVWEADGLYLASIYNSYDDCNNKSCDKHPRPEESGKDERHL